MKKFIVTNILLSAAAMTASSYGVNSAMNSSVATFDLRIPTSKAIKEVASVGPNMVEVKLKKEDRLKPAEVVESKLIQKAISPAKIAIKKKSKIQKKNNTKNSLELSYEELPEQGEYSIKKPLKRNWVSLSLNLSDYSDYNLNKKENKKHIANRISGKIDAVASTKNSRKSTEDKINNESDELVFFNYDESQPVQESQLKNIAKVEVKQVQESNVVNESKLLGNKNQVGTSGITTKFTKNSKPKIDFNNLYKKAVNTDKSVALSNKNNKSKTDTISSVQAAFMKEQSHDYSCLDESQSADIVTHESSYEVSVNSVRNNSFKKLRNFEIRFEDDADSIAQDYGEGVINLNYKMSTQLNIRRGVVYSKNHYPVVLDFVLEPGSMQASIPMLTNDVFNKLTKEHELRASGGQVLVELDDKTEDVELGVDTNYEAKLFIDSNFNVVDRNNSEYNYILFVGVETGNTIIHYKMTTNQITNKIVHIAADEMYYDPNFYAQVTTDNFKTYEENLLSNCKAMLNIDQSEITTWSYTGNVTKNSLNQVEVANMIYPLGTRKYYEFKHLEESIYVGRWSEENILVPSEAYINHVMNYFDLTSSDQQCVVQLNLSKKAKGIQYSGKSRNGVMNTQMNILDTDGQFYKDFSANSQRVFLLGEQQGILNIRLDYIDGTSQFMQSYCSDATYLVEQL